MRRTKKGAVKHRIYDALQEYRTPTEAIRYIREKHNQEVAQRTIYYHINQVKENKDPDYNLQSIPTQEGRKYRFISKTKEMQAEPSYLHWLTESYITALGMNDLVKLQIIHKDFLNICAWKNIYDEQFIEFLWEQAKIRPCIYLADQNITSNIWQYLTFIARRLKLLNSPHYKFVKKLDLFFQNIVLDGTRDYGVERLEAYKNLGSLDSPRARDTMFELLEILDFDKQVRFLKGSDFMVSEFELFSVELRPQVLEYASLNPLVCRKKLFGVLDKRKNRYGENEEGRRFVLNLLDETRHTIIETHSKY